MHQHSDTLFHNSRCYGDDWESDSALHAVNVRQYNYAMLPKQNWTSSNLDAASQLLGPFTPRMRAMVTTQAQTPRLVIGPRNLPAPSRPVTACSMLQTSRALANGTTLTFAALQLSLMPSPLPSARASFQRHRTSNQGARGDSSRCCGASTVPRSDPRSEWDRRGGRSLEAALSDAVLLDAGWLAELGHARGVLPRCQDVPPEARVRISDIEGWSVKTNTLGILVISMCVKSDLNPQNPCHAPCGARSCYPSRQIRAP